jgi:DNA-binding NarL/FixJ family response regulator
VSPDPNSIRILAVVDHPQFREAIAMIMATQSDINLVLVGCRPLDGSSARAPDRSDNCVLFLQLILPPHRSTLTESRFVIARLRQLGKL